MGLEDEPKSRPQATPRAAAWGRVLELRQQLRDETINGALFEDLYPGGMRADAKELDRRLAKPTREETAPAEFAAVKAELRSWPLGTIDDRKVVFEAKHRSYEDRRAAFFNMAALFDQISGLKKTYPDAFTLSYRGARASNLALTILSMSNRATNTPLSRALAIGKPCEISLHDEGPNLSIELVE